MYALLHTFSRVCYKLGQVGERLKPPDCKSGAFRGHEGSNPSLSTKFSRGLAKSGLRQRVLNPSFTGSNPVSPTKFMALKCYGSITVSKTAGRGSTPWRVARANKCHPSFGPLQRL